MLFIIKRSPFSQAGRRGFHPRLPAPLGSFAILRRTVAIVHHSVACWPMRVLIHDKMGSMALVERSIETITHGRYLVEAPKPGLPMLVGFHGYAESAEMQFQRIRSIGR